MNDPHIEDLLARLRAAREHFLMEAPGASGPIAALLRESADEIGHLLGRVEVTEGIMNALATDYDRLKAKLAAVEALAEYWATADGPDWKNAHRYGWMVTNALATGKPARSLV